MEPMELEKFILELRKQPIHTWTEKTAQNAAVVEILKMLGWPPLGMQFEYEVGDKRNRGFVDIKLSSGENHLLVECKSPGTNLDGAVGQLLNYAFADNTRLAVLTDGLIWDLYLPFYKSPTRHKFASIDLKSQRQPSDLVAELQRFLGCQEVETGEAERVAEERMKAIQRGEKIKGSLPEAWIDLVAQPPKELIALIANEVQKRSGHRPTDYQVCEFLSKRGEFAYSPAPSKPAPQTNRREPRTRQDFSVDTDRASAAVISAFVLWGQRTAVSSWVELLIAVTTIVYQRHGNDLDHMTNKVSWISRNRNILKKPNAIPGSPYYVNSYAGAKVQEARCRSLLKFFGHSPDDLKIIE